MRTGILDQPGFGRLGQVKRRQLRQVCRVRVVELAQRRLELTDNQTESAAIYAQCYKCHSRTSILANQSFRYHSKHIVDVRAACTTCHDSHGVSGTPHLINFNTAYVTKSVRRNAGPTYTSTGLNRGSCTLTCHGEDHNPYNY